MLHLGEGYRLVTPASEPLTAYRLDGFQAATSYLYLPGAEHIDPAHFWCFVKRKELPSSSIRLAKKFKSFHSPNKTH